MWCGVAVFVASAAMAETGQQLDKPGGREDVRTGCTVTLRRDAKEAVDARTLGDLLRSGCEPSEAVEMLSHFGVGVTPPFLSPELGKQASEKHVAVQSTQATHAER
jgi:hypothetical protein